MGGEPFLLPNNLRRIVGGLKASAMPAPVTVCSNGFWLRQWRDYIEILTAIDLLDITWHGFPHIDYQEAEAIVRNEIEPLGISCKFRGFETFHRLTFTDEPHARTFCKFCPQLLADGRLTKCHLIAYSKFYDHLTSEPFRRLRAEGFYDVACGNSNTLDAWYRADGNGLHECCKYCRYSIDPNDCVVHGVSQ